MSNELFSVYDIDLAVVSRAIDLAKAAHAGQERWDGSPYYLHCLRVANRVMHHGYTTTEAVVTAILHDVVEDTSISLVAIADMFGAQVADNVDFLSQRPGESRHAYFTRCMSSGQYAVLATKFADRVDNVSTIDTVPALVQFQNHVQTYFSEVQDYFLPHLARVEPGLGAELVNATARAVSYFKETPAAATLRFPILPDLAA